MHFVQIELVLQTENRSEPAKNRFSVALAQADLSLCWAHMPFRWFCRAAAHFDSTY